MKKLIFSSKYFMLLFMLTSMVYVGCHKEEGKELASASSESTQLRTTVTPTVENGTLKFNTLEDAFTFMNEISSLIKSEMNQEVESELDSENPAIEISNLMANRFGYTPLYKSSLKDSDGMMINPIFPDIAFNLIMNEDYEILIGDRLIVHKSTSEYYSISKNDNVNRQSLRSLEPGKSLHVSDLNSEIELSEFGDKVTLMRTKDCDCGLSLEKSNVSTPTSNFFILNHGCIGLKIGAQWKLTWTENGGSMSSNTISGVYNGVSGNNSITFQVPNSIKNFKITFCVTLDCNGAGPKEYCFEINKSIENSCCSKFHLDDDEVVFEDKGFKLYSQYQNGVNIYGYWQYGFTAFKSLSNGQNLQAKKLEIWLHTKNRTGPEINPPCFLSSNDDDYDSCKNCKWLSENVYTYSDLTFHKLGDVVFDYRGQRHSSFGANHINPNHCN